MKTLKGINLKNKGNIPEYNVKPRKASFEGYINTPQLILKFYDIRPDILKRGDEKIIKKTESILIKKIKQGEIEPLSGMGFTMLSGENVNVLRWGNDLQEDHVIIPWPQIYCYENNDINTMKLGDIDLDGPLCAYESIITAHEAQAWIKYNQTGKTRKDKVNYLKNKFYVGEDCSLFNTMIIDEDI